eukprot:5736072-Prymnesium_polylepis.1
MNEKKPTTFWGERVYLQKSDAGVSASQLYNELRALDSTVSEYSGVTPMVLVIDYTEYDADVWESGCEPSERTQPPSQPPSQSAQQPLTQQLDSESASNEPTPRRMGATAEGRAMRAEGRNLRPGEEGARQAAEHFARVQQQQAPSTQQQPL